MPRKPKSIVPIVPVALERIDRNILELRGHRVILDTDLAHLFGVPTKRLNEQIKRNPDRFPADFMFQLTQPERDKVVANCDHLKNLKFSPTLPYAFTEHGAIMAANVLNRPSAIAASVFIVRAFVKLREALASHADLSAKLATLEQKYDHQFKVVFDAIRQLMTPPSDPPKPRIGFSTEADHPKPRGRLSRTLGS